MSMTSARISRLALCLILGTVLISASGCRPAPPPATGDPGPADRAEPGVPEWPGEVVWRLEHEQGYVQGADFSPDGSLLVVGGLGEPGEIDTVDLLSAADGHLAVSMRKDMGPKPGFAASDHLTFSPDGAFVANGWQLARTGGDTQLDRWEVGGIIGAMIFFPDGSKVANSNAYGTGTIKVWQVKPDEKEQVHPLAEWEAPDAGDRDHNPVLQFAFSPDGQILGAAHLFGTVNLWRASDGNLLHSLDNGSKGYSLSFSPDGQTLAVVGEKRDEATSLDIAVVRLWRTGDWTMFGELVPPAIAWGEPVSSPKATFSPDGSLLALMTKNQVCVWEMPGGSLRGMLDHWIDDWADHVSVIAFSPDSTMLLVGTVGIWGEEYDDNVFGGSLTMWRLRSD